MPQGDAFVAAAGDGQAEVGNGQGDGQDDAAVPCPDLLDCVEECSDDAPIVLCMLACSDDAGVACSRCVVAGLDTCVRTHCPAIAQAFRACLDGCPHELMTCTKSACKLETLRFEACAADDVASGACQTGLAPCAGP
jgi:hypothetical protein